jgi:hypothetical protein
MYKASIYCQQESVEVELHAANKLADDNKKMYEKASSDMAEMQQQLQNDMSDLRGMFDISKFISILI